MSIVSKSRFQLAAWSVAFSSLFVHHVGAAFIDDPVSLWTGIPSIAFDSTNDQPQDERNIVGNNNDPAIYTRFDDGGTPGNLEDGTLAFRVRLAADTANAGFDWLFVMGIDGNQDGVLDIFIGVDNLGSNADIKIWDVTSPPPGGSPGGDTPANTALGAELYSTAWVDGTDYDWSTTTSLLTPGSGDLDGGGDPDYFLSFSVPFAAVVDAFSSVGIPGFNENSVISFGAITAVNDTNLASADIGGTTATENSTTSYQDLGTLSPPGTPAGDFFGVRVLPEPGHFVLFGLGAAWFLALHRPSRLAAWRRVKALRASACLVFQQR